jgi:di/tricarboxylate transporter
VEVFLEFQAIVVVTMLVLAAVLLATERMRPDMVAMLTLAVLMLFQILTPKEALAGFSNPATVAVACMFVLSAGLQSSGVVHYLGDRLLAMGVSREASLLLVVGLIVGPVSMFINNTAAVAIFLPIAIRACQGSRISPSRILMPLSFFAMLGGMCTLIGTSTNILVSSLAEDRDIEPFGMFEFTPIGLIFFGAGAIYLLFIGRRLLSERVPAESLTEEFHLGLFLSELIVLEGSPLAGKTLVEANLGERYDLEVLAVVRADGRKFQAEEVARLREGDLLLVKASAASLGKVRDNTGIAVKPGRHPDDADLRSADSAIFEALITPTSHLAGRTLKSVGFRNRYGATTLAIRRHGEDIREKIGKIRLRVGDELLILAPRTNLERLRGENDFLMLEEVEIPVLKPVTAMTSIAIVAGVVISAALGFYTVAVAAIIGSVLMVVTRCLPLRKVYTEVDWQVIFLFAGLIPMGRGLEVTGAADAAVDLMLRVFSGLGPEAVLSVFFFLAMVLTGIMSPKPTAALLAPLAVSTARSLGVDERAFLIALTFAASTAFYTPVGFQTNLLVYGPGGYRFMDFVKVGGPLCVVIWILSWLLIPVFFPL